MWTLLCRCGSAAQHQLRMIDKNLPGQAAHMKAMCHISVPKPRAHLCSMPDSSCHVDKVRIKLHLIHVRGNVAFLGCKLSVKGDDDASAGVLKHLHAGTEYLKHCTEDAPHSDVVHSWSLQLRD